MSLAEGAAPKDGGTSEPPRPFRCGMAMIVLANSGVLDATAQRRRRLRSSHNWLSQDERAQTLRGLGGVPREYRTCNYLAIEPSTSSIVGMVRDGPWPPLGTGAGLMVGDSGEVRNLGGVAFDLPATSIGKVWKTRSFWRAGKQEKWRTIGSWMLCDRRDGATKVSGFRCQSGCLTV
jgi:hypothetical protein